MTVAVPTRRRQRALKRRLGQTVRSGPFKGLALAPSQSWSAHALPYVLGSYEEELHEVIERLVHLGPTTVVDVGAAEGYYAIGIARRCPEAKIYASDTDDAAQKQCGQNAVLNGVADRVHVLGGLSNSHLQELLHHGGLLICDCEGCELKLLDPEKTPALNRTNILVELHDFVDPSITSTLLSRFKATHEIQMIDVSPREPDRYPEVPGSLFDWAVNEERPLEPHPMQWALLTPTGRS